MPTIEPHCWHCANSFVAMTPRPRTRLHPDERRRSILDAATVAFLSDDFSSVSLDEIARAAGVTRGLLHHYFGSKRALYLAVVERTAAFAVDVPLVPDGAEGTLPEVLDACVDRWLDGAAAVGRLWVGDATPVGFGGNDVGQVLAAARDALVERMVDELPLPPSLDRSMLSAAFRSFAAFARVATDDWLVHRTLDREQVHALLHGTLLALVEQVVPTMDDAARGADAAS